MEPLHFNWALYSLNYVPKIHRNVLISYLMIMRKCMALFKNVRFEKFQCTMYIVHFSLYHWMMQVIMCSVCAIGI